jgi:hypothetical protein
MPTQLSKALDAAGVSGDLAAVTAKLDAAGVSGDLAAVTAKLDAAGVSGDLAAVTAKLNRLTAHIGVPSFPISKYEIPLPTEECNLACEYCKQRWVYNDQHWVGTCLRQPTGILMWFGSRGLTQFDARRYLESNPPNSSCPVCMAKK